MPDRRSAAAQAKFGQPRRNTDPHYWIANLRNGRLHLALLVALVGALIIGLGVPITRTRASAQEPKAGAMLADDGLAATLGTQAESLTGTLAQVGLSPVVHGTANETAANLVPRSLLVAAARIVARGALAAPGNQASLVVQRQRAVPFTVHQGGFSFSQLSTRLTVGQALAGLGIKIGPGDMVSPGPEVPLTSGLNLYIRYANRIDLYVGGQQQTAYSQADTVGDLLAQAGVQLEPLDSVSPGADQPLRNGMRVDVTTVRESTVSVIDISPFSTIYRDDADLLRGDDELVRAGSPGYVHSDYRVVYVNGAEVSRELVGQTVADPVDAIVAQGTRVRLVAPSDNTPIPGDLQCATTMRVYATWYTAASAGGDDYTATGTPVHKGIVAVDPWVIPLGTQLYIPGYGYGLAADTGGGVIGNMIDLAYGDDDVYDWSTRWIDICILS